MSNHWYIQAKDRLEQLKAEYEQYYKEMDDAVEAGEADEIDEIYTRHDADLAPQMAVYFNDIAIEFSLDWDTEHDVYIEDSLLGTFPAHSPDKILILFQRLKERYLEWERK